MGQSEIEKLRDEQNVEITDLDKVSEDEASTSSPRVLVGSWLLSSRYRRQRTGAIAALVGLAVLVIFFSTPSFSQIFRQAGPTTPGPSPYYFGLDANPPWGHLSVDGKNVALIFDGAYTLFRLPPGRHTLTWSAAPFAPQQCVLSVPVDYGNDTCSFPDDPPPLGGKISASIRFPTDLSRIAADQRTTLLQLTQTMFDRQQSSEVVRVGEVYAQTSGAAGSSTRACTALQSAAVCYAATRLQLVATLRLQLDTGPSPAAPCAAGACDSGKQDCSIFCDLPAYVGFDRTVPATVWQATVLVHLLWQFATVDGRVMEERQADSFVLGQQNALLVPLNITWNGKQWGVTFSSGSYVPVCEAALNDMYTLALDSEPPNAEPQLVPGPTPASGCLIKIPQPTGPNGVPTPSTASPTVAYVISRFGVLLAVNAPAHRQWPFLPVADAYARQAAQEFIARGGE